MLSYLVLVVCATAALAAPQVKSPAITLKDFYASTNSFDERIIGGSTAGVGQFPWQVAVNFRTSSGSFFCGGSLISDTWVLTAAHCAEGALSFTLQLGLTSLSGSESGSVTVTTTTAIVHEGYNDWLNNDVALIKMNSPVTFSDTIQPIRLPERGSRLGDGVTVRISGWGKISDSSSGVSNVLNYVDVTTISNNQCANIYGTGTIITSTVCAVGNPSESTCNGDSGGPLVTFDSNGVATHQAVISFVHSAGCASGNPSGYVRTASMLDWIEANTGISV